MPLFGPPNVEKMKAKKDIKGLFKLMLAETGDLKTQACEAIIASGAEAVSPLLDLVKKKDVQSKERNLAGGLIKAIGSPAVNPLLAALDGKEDDRRLVALQALSAIGDPRSGEPILALLERTQNISFVSQLVAVTVAAKIMGVRAQDTILAYLLDDSSTFALIKAQTVAQALGDIGDERSVQVLVEFTQPCFRDAGIETRPQTRGLAAEALGKVAGRLRNSPAEREKAEAALAHLLKEYNPGLRAYACLALGQIIGHHISGPLIAALKDPEPLVRSSAAFGLRGSMDPDKVEPLSTLLRDADKNMRLNAIEGLGSGGNAGAFAPLTDLLKDPDAEVREAVVKSLLFFPHEPEALQQAINCLQDGDPRVRNGAVMVVATIGKETKEAAEQLLLRLQDADCGVRTMTATFLNSFKEPRVVAALIAGLQDPEWIVRYTCLDSLGQIGTPEAVAGLKLGLQDPDPGIRQAAYEVLSKLEAAPSEA